MSKIRQQYLKTSIIAFDNEIVQMKKHHNPLKSLKDLAVEYKQLSAKKGRVKDFLLQSAFFLSLWSKSSQL